MAKDRVVDIDVKQFQKYGFIALPDTTAAPAGSLRTMRNAQITDAGGLAPRAGTLLLGTKNTGSGSVRGLYNFRRSFGQNEILLKNYSTVVEFLSMDHEDAGWQSLKTGFTDGCEFGFVTCLVNTANQDYVIGSNRYEPYWGWTGATAELSTALVGAETTVAVDTTLMPDIYESKTATGNSATTLTVATANWATSQWVNFYIRITSGVYQGYIRKITANTSTVLTFDTLPGAPGNCTFEIRQIAFPASGTLVYGGNNVVYTAVPTDASFTVTSASAAAAGVVVTVAPTDYPAAPRGNRLANYLARITVGNVRSALTYDSGGALQGYAAAGTVFVSKLKQPFDFTYAATRVAGEGDAIGMPLGGGDITDVVTQEDTFYTFKPRYIEAIKYSQDTNDLAVRDPLKAGFGSLGKTTRGIDDIYFFTADKQITSLARVRQKDIKPSTLNIGANIDGFLKQCGVDGDAGRGLEIGNKVYFPIKRVPGSTNNDIFLVWNRDSKVFEGIWDLSGNCIEAWNDGYYFGDSTSPNVYQLFQGHADVEGTTRFGIDFEVISHAINLTSSKAYLQAMYGVVLEGYVGGGATFTTKFWSDFAQEAFLTFNFAFDEAAYLDGSETTAFLGSTPLALEPQAASYGDPLADGRRHFKFRVYIPFQYANYFNFGFSSNEPDNDFEVIRLGLIMKESPSVNANLIKYI